MEGPIKTKAQLLEMIQDLQAQVRVLEKESTELRTLYANVDGSFFFLDVEAEDKYRYKSINPAYLKETGLKASQVIGKSVSEVIPEPNLSLVLSNYRKAVISGESVSWEELTRFPSGNKFGDVTVTPIMDEQGSCTNLFVTVYDITEQKLIEASRKQAEIRFQSIVESANDAIIIGNSEGLITMWNKGAQKIFGYTKEEIINRPITVLMPEVYRDKHNKGLARFINTQIPNIIGSTVEVEGLRKDGTIFPLSISLSYWESNLSIYFSAIIQDNTERKQTEEKLQTSDKVFNHSIDMLCIMGFDGYLKVLNPAWTATLGWTVDELISRKFIEYIHQEDKYVTEQAQLSFVDGSEYHQFENRFLCKNGEYRWLSWNVFPHKKENILIGVIRDITENKKNETKLIKSKQEAEKSNQLKSEFLSQISHEIRTPVNTLISFADLLENEIGDLLSDDLAASFKYMDKAGRRILRTIDSLIKISELQTDNYLPDFKENNLVELLLELIEVYKPLADEKKLELKLIIIYESANCVFDRLSMYDVFNNLIENAIKFTKQGSVKIYVKKSLLNKTSISIIDTGNGIDGEYLKNIFEPFSQETSGYTRKYDGLGLGLTLVKQYCDLNDAEIFVFSEQGKGSNFTVVFN